MILYNNICTYSIYNINFYIHFYRGTSRSDSVIGWLLWTQHTLQTHVTLDDKLKIALPTLRYRRARSESIPRDPRKRVRAKRHGCNDQQVHIPRTNTGAMTDLQIPAIAVFLDESRREGFLKRKACLALSAPNPESQRELPRVHTARQIAPRLFTLYVCNLFVSSLPCSLPLSPYHVFALAIVFCDLPLTFVVPFSWHLT